MRLIVGGRAQGKRAYVETWVPARLIADGKDCGPEALERALALDHLHLLIRRWLDAGKSPLAEALALAKRRPDLTVICDEVGCGVVPMDRAEREWREAVGRVCCALAKEAEVERVVCGIPRLLQAKKPENPGGGRANNLQEGTDI